MKANQTAGVLLAGAMTTIAAADLLIPVSQERYLEVTASCYNNITGQSDYVSDYIEALDFGVFNESLSVSGACGGIGEADQLSQIMPDGISGSGSTSAAGSSSNSGWRGGTGHSYCSVTFEVAGWTYVVLTGGLGASSEHGHGTAAFSISDSVPQVLVEGEVEVAGPPGGNVQQPVDERLWLEWYPEWLAAWDWWTQVAIPTAETELR